jgi:serine/threonine-protein kinase
VDVAILDALEPILLRDPWDQKEALNRLKLLTRDFPDDARAHTLLARALSWFNDSKGEFDELERSLALDPNQPHTLYFEADHLAYNGEFDRARAAIARCLRLAATSLECLREEARIDGELGSCDHVEADARQMLAVEASSADAEQILANALYAQGSGLPALREVLARKRESMPVDERAESERADEMRLAVLSGDLSKADGLAQAASEAVAASAFASDHGAAARRVVMIEEELGRSSEAAKAASKYLEGRDGWQADTTFEDWAMAKEPTPLMLAAAVRGGAMTPEASARELARIVKRWDARVDPSVRNFIWIYAYASPAETARDAASALAALPTYAPLPPYKPESLVDSDIGRTYMLAGKVDEAVPFLERASNNCFPLDHPIESTRAHYFLGLAREAKHDTKGACEAYGVVRDRWGAAKPPSVTGQKALARIAALKCGG